MTDAILANPAMYSPAMYSVGWSLLQFVWQGALAAVLTAIVLGAFARRDPRIRYGIGIAGLLVMLILPIGTALEAYQGATRRGAAPAGGPEPVETVLTAPRVEGGPATVIPALAAAPETPTGAFWQSPDFERWLPAVVLTWLLGVAVLSLRTMGGWFVVRRLRRRGVSVRPDLSGMVTRMSRRLGLTRPVRAVESVIVQVPTVIGWFRPLILLPASAASGLSPEQLEAVIAHELAHVRRHDYLVNFLQTVAETLLFYHPGVWWVSRRIRIEREHCADDLAVAACGDPVLYAETLCELEGARERPALGMAATGGSLVDRIRRILGQPIPRERRSSAWLATLSVTVFILALGFGAGERTVAATPGSGEGAEILSPEPALVELTVPATEVQAMVGPEHRVSGLTAEEAEGVRAVGPATAPEQEPRPGLFAPAPVPLSVLPEAAQVVSPAPPAPPAPPSQPRVTVPVPQPFAFANQLLWSTSTSSGWLGVMIEDGEERGVRVEDVEEDSPAADAGIQAGDLITEYNGTDVLGTVQFQRLVGETPVGRTVPVTVVRDGREEPLEVTLSSRPSALARYNVEVQGRGPVIGNRDFFSIWDGALSGQSVLGLQVETMTPELREFFGAERNAGLLVVAVEDDSIAADAGIRVGDVIIAADGNRVDSPNGLRSLTQAVLASGNSVTLTVVRDRSERDVVVEPPAETAPNLDVVPSINQGGI